MQSSAVEAFSTTTKIVAADVGQSVDGIETVLNKLDGIFSLKEDQTTAR